MKIEIRQDGACWIAYIYGKSSPILRRVPNNAYPAMRATWNSKQDAIAELPIMLGCQIEIINTEVK